MSGLHEEQQLLVQAEELDIHVRALLKIIDETGGFMTPENQQRVRDARKAVARG